MSLDIRDHELVPEHRKLDEEEVNKLLDEFNITKDELPKMGRKDAVAKKMDVEPGDVVHIKRDSPTAGETDYYRVVVDE
ncbi:MAG: DNA-directed RNA polymerase subunit H [Candidatus Nanohaloarchaea archaeon]|nr:DNA-directed RNA polymerase subunit H [Candidatus Nanohaloarchaea archaeon]